MLGQEEKHKRHFTSIFGMEIFPEGGHLLIDHRLIGVGVFLVFPAQGESAPQGAVLLIWCHVLLLLLHLLSHQAVFVSVGDADLGADDDHHVGDNLTVIDHYGFDGAVQHSDFEKSHLLPVLEGVLRGRLSEQSGSQIIRSRRQVAISQ